MSVTSAGIPSLATDGKSISGNALNTSLRLGGGTLKVYPAAADGPSASSATSAWGNPAAFTQITASTAAAGQVVGVSCHIVTIGSNDTGEHEIDIATGAVSSEVVIATVRGTHGTGAATSINMEEASPVPVPTWPQYGSGVRLSVRIRCGGVSTATSARIALVVVE